MLLEPPKLHTLHVMESTLIDLSAWQFLRCTQKKAHRCCTCRQSQWAVAPCCRWHDTETKIYYLHQAPVRIEPLYIRYHRSISLWDESWRRYLDHKTQDFTWQYSANCPKSMFSNFFPVDLQNQKSPEFEPASWFNRLWLWAGSSLWRNS